MDELQTGIEMSLAVFPQSPVLVQPGKAALDYPALGDYRKLVKFAALGNLHRDLLPQGFFDRLHKWLTHIAAISKHALHLDQVSLAAPQRLQRPLAVRYLSRCHGDGVWQALCVHRNVALDARDFLARVIPLERCRVRVLHALRIHDQERRLCAAPQF